MFYNLQTRLIPNHHHTTASAKPRSLNPWRRLAAVVVLGSACFVFGQAAESVSGMVLVSGSPFPFPTLGNPNGYIGFSTNLTFESTIQPFELPATFAVQGSEGPGFASASYTLNRLALSGRVWAEGGNDYDSRPVVTGGFTRETLRLPDLPPGVEGNLEGAFRVVARVSNTFPGSHPLGENFFMGGAVADFTFFLQGPFGNTLQSPTGQDLRVGKQVVSGGKVTLDAMPADGIVRFLMRVEGVAVQAPFVRFSYSVSVSAKAWSGNINEPPLPWRGTCEVDFDIVWLAPRFVTDAGQELPLGRVLTETGEDVSLGLIPRGPITTPLVAAGGETFGFEVGGEPGARFQILSSVDLKTWTLVEEVVVPASGKVGVNQPILPAESGQYYRAEPKP